MEPENTPADESVPETEQTPTGDDTPAAAPTSDSPPETTEKRPSRARDRIQDLVAQNRAAIEFADMQKARADELESKLQKMTPAERAEAPKLADFETPEQWGEAFTSHVEQSSAETISKQVSTALEQHGIDASVAKRDQDFQQSLLTAADQHEDYWEVVADPTCTFLNGTLLETVKDLENPGEIVYYLNSHPTEARQIAALGTPGKIGAAIGRLNMETPPSPKPNVTEAPDPPTPIGGGPAGGVDPTKMSTKDYISWRVAERAARRAGAS